MKRYRHQIESGQVVVNSGTRDAVETAIDQSKDNLARTWAEAQNLSKGRISKWPEGESAQGSRTKRHSVGSN